MIKTESSQIRHERYKAKLQEASTKHIFGKISADELNLIIHEYFLAVNDYLADLKWQIGNKLG